MPTLTISRCSARLALLAAVVASSALQSTWAAVPQSVGESIAAGALTEADWSSIVAARRAARRAAPPAAGPLASGSIVHDAYVKASNTGPSDRFGASIAVSGDTVVVGAPGESSSATGVGGDQANDDQIGSGAAYVFARAGSTWIQVAYLKASNTNAGDRFGETVAIWGSTIVVAAEGEDSSATGVDGDQANNGATDAGAAYVFVDDGVAWSQQAYLKASNTDASDYFGDSLSISGDTIVVGARFEDSLATGVNGDDANDGSPDSGAAYVFTRTGGTWSQQAYLKASNTGPGDFFGRVAISGDTIAVGAFEEDSSATGVGGNQASNAASGSGATYVFVRSGATWTQQAYLKASNTGASDHFGWDLAIDGDTLAVGAIDEDSNATGVGGDQGNNGASNSGAVYVFARVGSTWSQQAYVKASNTDVNDAFGVRLALAGDTLAASSICWSDATGIDGDQTNNLAAAAGAAYVFSRAGTSWSQQAYVKASNTGAFDFFGSGLAIDAGRLMVSAQYEDSSATGVGGDPTNDDVSDAGAAYVVDLFPDPTIYCTAKVNSQGCTPQVAFAGLPQISGSASFDLIASLVLNNKNGLWFYGTSGLQAFAFQGGHLCVKSPIKRLMVRSTTGNPPPNDCSGFVSEDFNDKIRGQNGYALDPALTAGAAVGSQFWSRDPASPSTTSLTGGIAFSIAP